MNVSMPDVDDKSREVRSILCADRRVAGTDSSGTHDKSTSVLEKHALSNVERSGGLSRLGLIREGYGTVSIFYKEW